MPARTTERTPLVGSRNANGRQTPNEAPQDSPEFLKYRKRVLVLLVSAYTAYYFCKTNLPLAIPYLEKDEGLKRTDINIVLTSGYVMYLIGKFLSGYCNDQFGGRWTLIGGLVGSVISSILFTLKTNVPYFAVIRASNQIFSSVGWGGCVKIVRGWYPPSQAAHAIAIASLGETLGDAVVRLTLGSALLAGLAWQTMFLISAAVAAAILIPSWFMPGTPEDKGLEAPVEKEKEEQENMESRSIFKDGDDGISAILKSGRVWLLSMELLVVILVRESFASFVSSLIAAELDLSAAQASIYSAIFPAMGAVSSIGGGMLLDRATPGRRGLIPLVSFVGLTLALIGMWAVTPSSAGQSGSTFDAFIEAAKDSSHTDTKQIVLLIGMIGLVALFLYAPKVIIDGAFVMDLAGGADKVGKVTAFVTGVGYIGGCLSPTVSGSLADVKGWPVAILLMAGLSGFVTLISAVYWWADLKELRRGDASDEERD
ncbi:major facilitator superfamily domain-containing protein [Fimicolochytrium jonesii]|uniref:major facilitator superfamily domain-containing protein n=1 Tax=Fimicolochytrium jonesii TaxID=1396493 RepID=UPI0022FEC4CE|nr:major facilitator superfamily domain-containing protein [Fimicolochytrium jonesii]KAI8825898.1 major facilitator superfamily domain-containing protein [Fimicolochytrium jonesii]